MRNVFFYFIVVTMFIHCKSSVNDENNSTNSQVEKMIQLESKIYSLQSDIKKNNEKLKLGGELYKIATNFINDYPEDDKIERVYLLAARGAEANGNYDNAINYYYLAQRNFPESSYSPEYLKSRAIILDFKLNRKKEAILAHEELIELYPEHPLAIDSKNYLKKNLIDLPENISSEELEKILKTKD